MAWTENVTLTFDDSTPAKTVEGKGTIDLDTLGATRVTVQIQIAFGGSADGNAEIRVRSSSDSGTTKDTELWWQQEVSFTISTTKRVSFVIEKTPYVEIGVYNGNSAAEDITIAGIYAWE